jgi:hypothetical protein
MIARALACCCLIALIVSACGHNSTTSPTTTTTTTTTTTSPVTTTETFEGTLGIGGTLFYPFTVAEAGTVTATLASIGGPAVPSTVQVRLGIGTITDDACTATTMLLVNSTAPTVTASEAAGAYCANVTDVGNLYGDAAFTVTIAHP